MPTGRRHLEDRQRLNAPGRTQDDSGASLRQRYLLASATIALAAFLVVGTTAPARADFETGVAAFDGGDFTNAYNEWLPLAAGGDPFAQRNIGHLYRLGLGVPQDFAVAFNWYQRAADQGLVRAQANLANMMLRGQGIDQDPEGAASWFHRAASAGHAISQFNIGQMYRKGLAVPQDTGRALGWFQLAADAGHERSIELVAIMTAEGVAAASDDALLEAPFGQDAGRPATPQQTEEPAAEEETARLDEDDDDDDPFASLLGDDEDDAPPAEEADEETDSPRIDDDSEEEPGEDELLGGEEEDEGETSSQDAAVPATEPDASDDSIIGGESGTDDTAIQPAQDDLDGTEGDFLSDDDEVPEARPAPSPQIAATAPEPLTREPRISDEAMAAAVSEGLRAFQGKDYTTALRTWLPLAEAGNRDAQFFVGGLYMDGAGVTEDQVRAHAWWRLSADQGHSRASEFLEVIVTIMTADQLSAARDLAGELRAAIR